MELVLSFSQNVFLVTIHESTALPAEDPGSHKVHTLCETRAGGKRVLTSGQNQLFPLRGYTAETYAKVMGGSPPSQPRIKLKCTLFVC